MCPSFIEDVHKQPCHMDNSVEGEDPSTQKEAEQHEEKGILACNVDFYMLFSIHFQDIRKQNKENREKERDLHTSGRRGYQQVEDDMVNNCDDILSDMRNISIIQFHCNVKT